MADGPRLPLEFGSNEPSRHLVFRLRADPDVMCCDLRDELQERWPELGLEELNIRQFHRRWALPAKKAVHGEREMPDFEEAVPTKAPENMNTPAEQTEMAI